MSDRETIFISHATDDNEFVRWLGPRLTARGYRVWADLFELGGGTPFWAAIEHAIRNRAIKFIAVVSHASCDPNRSSVLDEIALADTMKKTLGDDEFIIPVRIDNVPFAKLLIQIHRLNALDFSKGWGELFDTLEVAGLPRPATKLTAEFDRWRANSVRSRVRTEQQPEPLFAGILPILRVPEEIYF